MTAQYLTRFATVCLTLTTLLSGLRAEQTAQVRFREVLELAEVGEDKLTRLGSVSSFNEADWSALLQVLDRLKQFRTLIADSPAASSTPAAWEDSDVSPIGQIFEIQGRISSVRSTKLPVKLSKLHDLSEVFESRFQFSEPQADESVLVLSRRIPKSWLGKPELDESVVVRGVLANTPADSDAQSAVVIADHIGWYPTTGAPTGQLLLARQGMDVALLDEVMHRQPFVKPSVSREGEAFYAGLKALRATDQTELIRLAKENVSRVAAVWRERKSELDQDLLQKRQQLERAESDVEREPMTLAVRIARTRRDLAITIARQAEQGQSSVATMFLQPGQEVGELFYFEGTARRAVWIAGEKQQDIKGYYEVEVFPAEARLLDNRPVVCCMNDLPTGFPEGDEIREPVRIAAVFFKSWRYRARDTIGKGGETEGPRQLYTPVLLSKRPIWLNSAIQRTSSWALWGGVVFLVALVTLWASMAWLSRNDRRVRSSLRPPETLDL